MDFNYGRNVNRRRVNNQTAASPYSRPQENRYIPSMGRPMVTTHDRHSREHISNRYGNALDDIPQQAGPAMPQTPARSTYARPRFQTPFAPSVACPDSPQMCVVPRAPYSSGGDLDEMMMPIGSPATPQARYTDYEPMGHYNTPAPRFARRPIDHIVYDHYPEINESMHSSETHDYNMPVLKSAPQEFPAPFNKNPSPQPYGAFMRSSHQYPSPIMQTQYEEPTVNAYKMPNPVVANTRQYLYEPMEEAVEEGSFAKLSLDKDSQEGTSRQSGGVQRPAGPQKAAAAAAATPGPVPMSKKAQEPAPSAQKDAADKNIVMSGPIEKVLKWDALLNANPMILYETIGPLVQVRQGERADEKIVLLRDASTPVLQCVFSEVDRCLPLLHPGQLVRCVGKMMSSAKMRGFSVRPATDAEKKCLLRMSFIINRVVNDMTKEKKPDPAPAVRE